MTSYFAPLRANSAEPVELDMQSLFLSGRILPFGAKLSVTHMFRSSEKSSVEVVYCFPLPRDATLVSFQILGENFSISSRLERASDAQKRYEEALERGSLAALTQQNADGLVNLTVGHLRPGETVSVRLDLIAGVSLSDNGFRLRFPFTVAPCYHSQMRVSVDRPGIGRIELPDDAAGGVFLPPLHADGSNLHKIGFELLVEPADAIDEIASPSHAVSIFMNKPAVIGIKLSPDRDVPNRDLVLDVKCDLGTGRAWSDRVCGDRKHFAVIAPSTAFGQVTPTARRIVFLLDRSGLMGGTPIEQARHAIENCLANLSPEDQFGIVAFDSTVEHFGQTMLPATRENVEGSSTFLNGIDARGGTELGSGIEAAAQLLAGTSGEIFVITDGQVFGTSEIVRRAQRCKVRLFCLGIGSASQDRFLELLARQTGGICRFVTPSERVDAAAFEVFAAIGGTVAAGVHVVNANVQPASTGRLFAASPFAAFGDIHASADTIALEWPEGERRLPIEALEMADGFIRNLQGAKLIADFEAGYNRADPAARQLLFEMSERYDLASSEMSLVAVVERSDDKAGDVPKTKIVPVGMAQHTKFRAYFDQKRTVYAAPCRLPSAVLFDLKLDVDEVFSLSVIRHFLSDSASEIELEATGKIGDTGFLRSAPRSRITQSQFLPLVREAIRIVENYLLTRANTDITDAIRMLTSALVTEQSRVKKQSHIAAVSALIAFFLSDVKGFLDTRTLNRAKWIAVREQLETTWPELKSSEPTSVKHAGTGLFKAGMVRKETLQTFENWVNQPGTMFSTDRWLQPKLEQLTTLLTDPITEEQAIALTDVLYQRRRMGELIAWLEGPPMPWQSFFVLREFVDPGRNTRESVSIQTDAGLRWF